MYIFRSPLFAARGLPAQHLLQDRSKGRKVVQGLIGQATDIASQTSPQMASKILVIKVLVIETLKSSK